MALSAALICGAAFFSPRISLVLAAVVFLIGLMLRNPVLLSLGLILIVCARANASLEALHAPLPPSVSGLGQLMADPEPQMFGTQLLLSVDGRRYLATVPLQDSAVVRPMMMGEHLQVTGRVSELRGAPAGWVQARHLAGRLQLNSVKAAGRTAPWYQLANAVHSRVSAGADSFPEEQRSLYLGLVLGDDRGQSEILKFRFQASGLSHLLAVSGQNVAFLLAVAAPVLRRMPLRLQVFFGVLLLAMFAIVTRGEPSVLRAAVMAAIALSSVAAGRLASGLRVLSMTIIALVITDPLLVHSIGFQLSIIGDGTSASRSLTWASVVSASACSHAGSTGGYCSSSGCACWRDSRCCHAGQSVGRAGSRPSHDARGDSWSGGGADSQPLGSARADTV